MTEDEVVGWHHQLNGHEFEQAPGVRDGQGTVVLEKTLETARRSNQPILKEISPGYSLEGLMLKLKLQYFVHLMRRLDSFEKILMLGKIKGKRRRGRQRMRWLDSMATQWT